MEELKELQTMLMENKTPVTDGNHNIDHGRAAKLVNNIFDKLIDYENILILLKKI